MGRAIVNKDNVVRYATEVFDLFNQGFITSEMVVKLIRTYVEENTTYEDQPTVAPYKAPKPGIGLRQQIEDTNPYQYKVGELPIIELPIIEKYPRKNYKCFCNFLNWDYIYKG